MAANHPLRPHVGKYRAPPPRVAAPVVARAAVAPAHRRKTRHREWQHAFIAAVAVALVLGGSISVYALHARMTHAAANARALAQHTAAVETGEALSSGAVVFVPEYGHNCRRRWLDNKTGVLREGGELHCDDAVGLESAGPTRAQKFERRIDAIRNGFQTRNGAGPD
jgi:hypothetical protein